MPARRGRCLAGEAVVSSRSMKTTPHSWVSVLTGLLLPVYVGCAHAQSTPRPPEFRVDPTWPTIPNNWVLGEVTSISVDRNDNIWVLHVPQSIPEDKRANAAPPVLQFDAAGKLLTSWGGPGNGAEWLGREHGIFVDANDFVWIGGRAGWPRATTPGVSDDMIMKFTMSRRARHADRPQRTEHRQSRYGERPSGHRRLRRHAARRRSTSPTATATSASSSSTRRPGSSSGCGARSATRRRRRSRRTPRRRNRRRRPTARRSSACRTRSRCRATGSSTSRIGSTTASSCSRARGSF